MPGKPDESELIARIESRRSRAANAAEEERQALTAEQIAVLRRWVEQGADVDDALGVQAAPEARAARRQERRLADQRRSTGSSWPGSRPRGSRPSPRPSKTTLIRRVTLDLTGLPPTLEEVDAFLADRVTGRL